jgi:hypothetical protein
VARIRTIKPEFPQSESMGRVSRDARLLFIQLWTICDDSGRTRGNSRMLASLLFPYDDDAPKLLDGWIAELERESCVVRYSADGATYLQVCNWLNHQKIDKPSPSKLPEFDESSRILSNPLEHSSVDRGPWTKDQGVDQNLSPPASRTAIAKKPKSEKKDPAADDTALQAACRETWRSYLGAYHDRYGTEPVRNAKVNAAIKGFVQRVGIADAPSIAAFYVAHDEPFYVRKCHDTGQLLADAEKLRTEWKTGRVAVAQAPPRMSAAAASTLAAARTVFGTEIEGDGNGSTGRVIDITASNRALGP